MTWVGERGIFTRVVTGQLAKVEVCDLQTLQNGTNLSRTSILIDLVNWYAW